MRRLAPVLASAVIVFAAVLAADERVVLLDDAVDFSALSTFAVRDAGIVSDRPELNVPIVAQSIGDAIRRALVGRGFTENRATPDFIAEFSVQGVDFSIGPFGKPAVVASGRRGRRGQPSLPVDFTEGTLVVDVRRANAPALLWRGVYRVADEDAQALVEALAKNASRLASISRGSRPLRFARAGSRAPAPSSTTSSLPGS